MSQHAGSGFDALYHICRASGGSSAMIETTVRQMAFASSAGPAGYAVNSGGIAVSSAQVAEVTQLVREVWQSSAGSRALFEEKLKRRLGLVDGGRKFLAALSLACVLQTTFAPAVLAYVPTVSTYVSADTVSSGQIQNVMNNGSAIDTKLYLGGIQNVSIGGYAGATTVYPGAIQNVYSLGTAGHTNILGGVVNISNGGSHFGGSIESGGTLNLYNGASGRNPTVLSGGIININGGYLSGVDILEDGIVNINNGGYTSGFSVRSGGSMNINAYGTAEKGFVDSGGVQNVYGSAVSMMIGNNFYSRQGGVQNIYAGGIAINNTLEKGGVQNIYHGGTASGTYNSAYQYVFSGGTAYATSVLSSGTLTVYDGGILAGANIISKGVLSGNNIILRDIDTTLNFTSGTSTQSTSFAGAGGLIKTGTGTLTLTGGNTYTGGTTVSSGALAGNIGPGNLTVANSATYSGMSAERKVTNLYGSGTIKYTAGLTVQGGTFNGTIDSTNSGGLSKTGAGTLTLTGTNAYTGGTTVNAGTLQIGNGGATGSISGNITNSASLIFNRSNAVTYSGMITGTGSLTKSGAGTLTLTGNNDYTGGTTVSAGTLQIGNGGSSGSIAGNITNNANLTFNRANAVTYSGMITGTGSLTKSGTGTLTLTGNNDYTGTTTVSAGGLTVTGLLGGGTYAGAIANRGALTFNQTSNQTLTGAITGNGSITKQGNNTLTLTGNNDYTGTTTVSAGTLQIGDGGASGSVAGNITNSSNLIFNRGNEITYAGKITGTGSLTKTGVGTLTLTSTVYQSNITLAVGKMYISGGATATGNFTASAGTTLGLAALGTATPTLSAGSASIGGAYLDILNYDGPEAQTLIHTNNSIDGTFDKVFVGGLEQTTPVPSEVDRFLNVDVYKVNEEKDLQVKLRLIWDQSTSAHGTFNVVNGDNNDANFAVNTVLRNNMDGANDAYWDGKTLTKTGTGSLTLTAANEYTGGTVISAGTVVAGHDNALGNGDVRMQDSTTLGFSGTRTLENNITLSAGAASVNTSGYSDSATLSGEISGAGTLIKTGAGTLTLTNENNDYTGDTTVSAGTLSIDNDNKIGAGTNTLAGGTLLLTGGSYAKNWEIDAAGSNALHDNNGTVTFNGILSGEGSLTKQGGGTLTLTGANTYEGATTVDSGTLKISGSLDSDDSDGNIDYAGAIANSGTLMFEQAVDQTLSGEITGNGTLIKKGDSTLTLTGDNGAYAGVATISAGILQIGDGGGSGSIAGNITNSANLTFNRSGEIAYSGAITGTGSLTKTGDGTLTLSGANEYSGGTSINSGTVVAGNNAALGTGAVTMAGNTTLGFSNAYTLDNAFALNGAASINTSAGHSASLIGVISGDGSLTKAGDGSLTLSASNNYTGGTNISGGTVFAGHAEALGTGGVTMEYGTTLGFSGNHTLGNAFTLNDSATLDTAGYSAALGGKISGDGALIKTGTGSLTLTASNEYSGGTVISAGTVIAGHNNAFGNMAGEVTMANDTTLEFSGNRTLVNDITLSAGTATLDTADYSAVLGGEISGAGALIKTGTGTLTLTNDGNDYAGGTTVNSGTLSIDNDNKIGTGTNTLAGGTLLLTGDSYAKAWTLGAGSNVLHDNDSAVSFGGILSGTGSLAKQGEGTLTLTGANDYAGGTTVSAGTLQIGDGGISGSIAGNITNNANLTFNRSGEIAYSGAITGTGSLTKTGGGTLTLKSSVSQTNITLNQGGLIVDSGNTLTAAGLFTASAGTTLGLHAVSGSTPVVSAYSADITGAELDILSYTEDDNYPNTYSDSNYHTKALTQTVIRTDSGIEGNFAEIKAGGTAVPTDAPATLNSFLKVGVKKENNGNDLQVTNVLVWKEASNAHGTFNVESQFTVDATLADNAAGRNPNWWDGTTLTKTGGGTLTLARENTYTGGTDVESGKLVAGDAKALGIGTVTMEDATSLEFLGAYTLGNDFTLKQGVANQNAGITFTTDTQNVTLAGDIDGTGTLIKTGAETLSLTGQNSYSGGTVVSAGTLAGDTKSLQGAIAADSSTFVRFFQNSEGIFNGTLSGNGTLEKYGTGKLILNAIDNNVGAVDIKEGKFIVGGDRDGHSNAKLTAASGSGNVNVHSGALLGGHGTIEADVFIRSGGILSPGNSYGITKVGGNLHFAADALFDVEVNPDVNAPLTGDMADVTGTATLAGTFRHLSTGGTAADYADPAKEWTVLRAAGGISGTFDNKMSDLAFLIPLLNYSQYELKLSFQRGSFGDFAHTGNENAVAATLDSLGAGSNLLRDLLNNVTQDQGQRVLQELSGEAHVSLKSNLLMADSAFMRRLSGHVSSRSALRHAARFAGLGAAGRDTASADAAGGDATNRGAARADDRRPWVGNNLWVSVNQGYSVLEGGSGIARSTLYGTELAGGYDAEFVDGWMGGLALRFNVGKQSVDDRRSEADVTSYTAALYGGKELPLGPGTLRFLLSGALTLHNVESDRKVRMGSHEQTLEASYGGRSIAGSFETAYRFAPTETLFLEPYASIGWRALHLDGFTEKGGNAALRNGGEDWNHALSTLGLRVATPLHERVEIEADLGWQHIYGETAPKSAFAFREGSDKFTVKGVAVNRDAAVLGLRIGVKLTDNVKIGFHYDGELGARGQSHAGRAVLEVRW